MRGYKKALLITVSAPSIVKLRRTRYIRFQQCTMPYLAAYFSDEWSVIHVDEECEEIDFSKPVDLVALTFHTPSAAHAYEIASRFRKLGIYVIMGGPHVTLLPDEAALYADTIFIGEAEETFPHFLSDYNLGTPSSCYRCELPPSLDNLPFVKKELFHRRDHSSGIICATRGCPNRCEFCSLISMYGHSFRCRPVDQVSAEFMSFKGKIIIFWDDNLTADMKYAKNLMRAILPAKKWWSSQVSIHAGMDEEFLALASASGCKHLFFGLESISQNSLNDSGKSFNRVDKYMTMIHNVHKYGIGVQVGIVFGFDGDSPCVFNDTIEFLEEAGVQNATLNILTPYPGTPLFKRLENEGRILTYDWSKYNSRANVVFQPKNMSPDQLLEGFWTVNKRFYSFKSIAKRTLNAPASLLWEFPLNLMYAFKWLRYDYSKF